MTGIFIVAAKRTPFGSFGGSLKKFTPTQLGVIATKSALSDGNIDPSLVDHVFFGNVIPSSSDGAYLARHIGLQSGIPISTPALSINRLCGSGFETVAQGLMHIATKRASVVVCGGTENMSMAPFQVDGNAMRWGNPLGTNPSMRDSLWDGLTDQHAKTPMGVTAENLAEQYNISRQECDEFAIRSQQTWAKAKENGVFDLEIAPVEVKPTKKNPNPFVDTDEHPRPSSTFEKINSLPPVFKKEGGVVTAANASGICDGAGSIILASEEAVVQHDLTPLARIASTHVSGCEPTIMGIGPVEAIRGALEQCANGTTLGSMDRVEINEAFAAQCLACAKELDIDMDKFNVNGGAIALGHPLGASGSRIMAHLAHNFSVHPQHNLTVGAACIGGGQGIAIVLERA